MAQQASRRKTTTSSRTSKTRSKQSQTFRKRLENLSVTVIQAEKNAEKQVQKILKATDKYKREQLKKVRQLVSEARKLKSNDLVSRAEKIRDQIEKKANSRMKAILSSLDIPSKKEIEQLKTRIAQLETELKEKEAASTTTSTNPSGI